MTPRRTRLLMVLTVTLTLLAGLAASEWVLRWQRDRIQASDRIDPGMILYDPLLGWRLKPHWQGEHRHHDFHVRYHINGQGFRGRQGPVPREALAVLGDSFTFGLGVDEGATFIDRLDQHRGPTLNLGIPGYSTDQQLLLLESVERRLPRHVLLVVYLGNDLADNLLDYPLQADQAKPRFVLEDGRLRLRNTPVPQRPKPAAARRQTLASLILGPDAGPAHPLGRLEIARRLGLFQPRSNLDEARLQQRLRPALDLFHALATKMQQRLQHSQRRFAVALLAGRRFVEAPASPSARYQDHLRRRLIDELPRRGIPVIDLALPLRQQGGADLYHPNEGHLNQQGHRRIANILADELDALGWTP